MAEERKGIKINPILIGVVSIVLGILFNKYILERTVVLDDEIRRQSTILLIIGIQIVLIGLGIFLLIKKPNIIIKVSKDFSFYISLFGLGVSFLLLPPVFSKLLAMSHLLPVETTALWIFCLLLAAVSLFILLYRGNGRLELSALFMGVMLLVSIELTLRFFVVVLMPGFRQQMANLGNITYLEFSTIKGHPFLQYTNNPNFVPMDKGARADHRPVNSFGFIGPEYTHQKPDGVIRVACLGGSTTAKGYPKVMGAYLNGREIPDGSRFEVMNFGIGGYTTAHTMINFILNVVEFDPDYIVIHHAWNKRLIRNSRHQMKSDYSHEYKYYHEPEIIDRYPIRISIIYRYIRNLVSSEPTWKYLATAVCKRDPDQMMADAKKFNWNNQDQLNPYRRNIETIIDLALARGIKVVLTSQPHTVNPDLAHYYIAPHIDQCNTILREIGAEYQNRIFFVDLDSMMTDKMDEVFIDLGHMNDAGMAYKAEQFGRVIFDDWVSEN